MGGRRLLSMDRGRLRRILFFGECLSVCLSVCPAAYSKYSRSVDATYVLYRRNYVGKPSSFLNQSSSRAKRDRRAFNVPNWIHSYETGFIHIVPIMAEYELS
eukprot:scaffold40331_cov31-Attheya_sp.AAC.1